MTPLAPAQGAAAPDDCAPNMYILCSPSIFDTFGSVAGVRCVAIFEPRVSFCLCRI